MIRPSGTSANAAEEGDETPGETPGETHAETHAEVTDDVHETQQPAAAAAADRPRWISRAVRWPYLSALAATFVFAAVCLGFLLNTPTLLGPDEPYHLDRVIAAEHGQVFLGPGSIHMGKGARGVERTYVFTRMLRGGKSQADYTAIPRVNRPSLASLGGNTRSMNVDVANYETQHPPLYYGLMGGLLRLWPNADAMAGDKLVLLIRAFNVLLVLPLPFLFFVTARRLWGDNAIAHAAAFTPLLIPGLARCASTINNDNLAIPIGAMLAWLTVRVLQGDRSTRTAILVAVAATAGALTKATVVFLLPFVALAYVLQVWRLRRLPSRGALVTLIVGAIASSTWWLYSYADGNVQEKAWGIQYAKAQGPPRGDIPINYRAFVDTMRHIVPFRFWGGLGLLEPPELPATMVALLNTGVAVFIIAAIVLMRRRRWDMTLVVAMPIMLQGTVIAVVFLHYRHFLSLPGVQGRYVYPGVFGVVAPFALGAVLLLRRWSRWAPLLTLAVGLVVSGWGLYTSVEYTWLHHGQRLVPSNWADAFHNLESFFPLLPAATITLSVLGALLVAAAVVLAAVRGWVDREPVSWRDVWNTEPVTSRRRTLAAASTGSTD